MRNRRRLEDGRLRDPPEDLVQHVHQSLKAAAAWKSKAANRRGWVSIPAICAAAAAILFAFLLATHSRPKQSSAIVEVANVSPKNIVQRGSAFNQDPTRFSPATHDRKLPARPISVRKHLRRFRRTRDAASLFNYPLTHQERLLVQFVRTAKPADLQALNPAYQAKLEAKEEADFAAYLQSGDQSTDSSSNGNDTDTPRSIQNTQE